MVPRSFITLLLRYLVLVSSLISILADENSGTSKLQIQVCFVLIDLMSSCGSFLLFHHSPLSLLHYLWESCCTSLHCTVLYCVHYIVDTTGSAKGRWVSSSSLSSAPTSRSFLQRVNVSDAAATAAVVVVGAAKYCVIVTI